MALWGLLNSDGIFLSIRERNLLQLEKKIEDIKDQMLKDITKNLDPRKMDQLANNLKQSELSEYLNLISKMFKTS